MQSEPSNHIQGSQYIQSSPEKSAVAQFGAWPLLAAAFGALLVLMLLSGLASLRKAEELYDSLSELNQSYRRSWRTLEAVRTGIHVSSVLIRDFLLDPSQLRTREIRHELLELRRNTEQHLRAFEQAAGDAKRGKLIELRAEINGYWESLDPVFDWTPEDKQAFGYVFLRRSVMPRREAVLLLAQEVQNFTETTLQQESEDSRRREAEFRGFLVFTIAGTLGLGFLVALVATVRLARLERKAKRHRERIERAEDEMRRLSHRLVSAQEEERKAISRELHDEIGQMLTGLRMDIRSLKRLNGAQQDVFEQRVDQSCVLLEQTLQAVRDMAMGLRPSMLDDVGLAAALQWQAREFERRHDIGVTLTIDGDLSDLPDRVRTGLYRIVQEGLTNCARHARASSVQIHLEAEPERLRLQISDDGIGMDARKASGLGLVGIQERVRELDGSFALASRPGSGTSIEVELKRQTVTDECLA